MTSEADEAPQATFRPSRRLIVISVLAVFAFGALMVFNLLLYATDNLTRSAPLVVGDPGQQPLHVEARVQGVDYNRGELSIRVEPRPGPQLRAADGVTLGRTIRALTNGVSDRGEATWLSGKAATPIEIRVEMFGLVSDYPFDEHDGAWILSFVTVEEDGRTTPVPFSFSFQSALPGTQIEARAFDRGAADRGIELEFVASRATSSVYFSVLVMVIMWALAITILVQSYLLAFRGRKIEPTMFGYMGAMIFAFPTLRNSMPGAPPIGVLADYLAFFWAEAIVALAMLLGLLAWIYRPYK